MSNRCGFVWFWDVKTLCFLKFEFELFVFDWNSFCVQDLPFAQVAFSTQAASIIHYLQCIQSFSAPFRFNSVSDLDRLCTLQIESLFSFLFASAWPSLSSASSLCYRPGISTMALKHVLFDHLCFMFWIVMSQLFLHMHILYFYTLFSHIFLSMAVCIDALVERLIFQRRVNRFIDRKVQQWTKIETNQTTDHLRKYQSARKGLANQTKRNINKHSRNKWM